MKRFLAVAVSAALVSPVVVIPTLLVESTAAQPALGSTARSDLDKIAQFLEQVAEDKIQYCVEGSLYTMRLTATGILKRTIDRMSDRLRGLEDPKVQAVVDVISEEAEAAGEPVEGLVIAELVATITTVRAPTNSMCWS